MQMKSRKRNTRATFFWLHSVLTLSAVATVLVSAVCAAGWADALYILTGIQDTAIILRDGEEHTGLSSQLVYLSETGSSHDVILTAGQRVTISHSGETVVVEAKQERVSTLLDRLRVQLTPLEMVLVDLSSDEGAKLTIAEDITYYDRETVPVPYATVRRPSEELASGEERVAQQGRDGVQVSVYEAVWSGGELISHQLVEETFSGATDEIIEYGVAEPETETYRLSAETELFTESAHTDLFDAPVEDSLFAAPAEPTPDPQPEAAPSIPENNDSLPMDTLVDVQKNDDGSGYLFFQSGRVVKFKSIKNMTATAYNKDEPKVGTITATGTTVHKGVVAVDKRVIPLGTKMYIVAKGYEYGYSVAEDTGVFGNVIDLYFESYRGMVNFGRRSCTAYILE